MITIPWAAVVILALAAASGIYLLSHGRHQCTICYRPLPRVCRDAECGQITGPITPVPSVEDLDWATDLTGGMHTGQWRPGINETSKTG
jgi:hypothetical protein